MRILLAIVAVLALAWGGWWFVSARALERAAEAALAAAPRAGIAVGHAGIEVRGFPNRLDLTISAPTMRDPARMSACN